MDDHILWRLPKYIHPASRRIFFLTVSLSMPSCLPIDSKLAMCLFACATFFSCLAFRLLSTGLAIAMTIAVAELFAVSASMI